MMLVSIIVPIYNVEQYLRKCIESIIEQTYRELNIILVDDGSIDRSGSICDEYARCDSRIVVVHKSNGGLVSARKAGARLAEGDYIVNVDGDDWIEKDRIEKLVEEGLSTNVDMVYMSGIYYEYKNYSILDRGNVEKSFFYRKDILDKVFNDILDENYAFKRNLFASQYNWAIKKNIYVDAQNKIDNSIRNGEDQICIWFCLLNSNSVLYTCNDGYHYVQRENSITYGKCDLEKDKNDLRIWYLQMRKMLDEKNASSQFYHKLDYLATRMLIVFDYGLLYKQEFDYLYPFIEVKKGSKIAIYGGGKVGRQIIDNIKNERDFEIVCVADKNNNIGDVCGYDVVSVEQLIDKSFDYILIAIIEAETAEKIVNMLIEYGIECEKIVRMSREAISRKVVYKALDIDIM